jgi:phage baseplate assembly protein gpV
MESKNRNTWIIVIVVLVVLCCIAAAVGAMVVAWLVDRADEFDLDTGWTPARESERTELTFDLGATPYLELDSFAGNVTVRATDGDTIRVIATKRASRQSYLDNINIDWDEMEDGLRIKTSHQGTRLGNVSVDFEITVPDGARLDLDTAAGNVTIQDVAGEIQAHSGAGNVTVLGASGSLRLDTGADNVDYEGTPRADCRFDTGAGNITLRLPSDVDVEVVLDTGVGNVSVGGFDVDGTVNRGRVDGVIGTGTQGSIRANTGAGNINLVGR